MSNARPNNYFELIQGTPTERKSSAPATLVLTKEVYSFRGEGGALSAVFIACWIRNDFYGLIKRPAAWAK